MTGRVWTASDIKLLRENYPTFSKSELMRLLNRSWPSIKSRAAIEKLTKSIGYGGKMRWNKESDAILSGLYPDNTVKVLVAELNVSPATIYNRAKVLGLKKSAAHQEKMRMYFGKILEESGKKNRFVSGQPGWNKGVKITDYMSAENIEKCAATRFKKGQDPHNTVPIGSIRMTKDGYYEIKVCHLRHIGKNKNYKAVHRVLYEKLYGPIPKDGIVAFADGNQKNLAHDNLILLTRAQSMRRSHMSDLSILKKQMKITDDASIQFFRAMLPDAIQVYRNLLIAKIKLNERTRKNSAQAQGKTV